MIMKYRIFRGCSVLLLLVFSSLTVAESLPNFRQLFKDNVAAIVNVTNTSEGSNSRQGKQQGFGSGFIISQDGYILTNNHVVRQSQNIIVRLQDRTELKARLIGADPQTDVALIKITYDKPLPVVRIGNSDASQEGDWVAAIGSPFGLDYSITIGIVSAKGRRLPNETYVPFIQTDAAVNPGNSGGPLFNVAGEVIGINSQIFSRTGTFAGLAFAIPIKIAMDVAKQLKETGKIVRGWLGVTISNVDHSLLEAFDIDKPVGALILEVYPDSPAQKSGLRNGDIVLRFGADEIIESSDLPVVVGRAQIGSKVAVDIIRHGKKTSLDVIIGSREADAQGNPIAGGIPSVRMLSLLGFSLENLPDDQRNQAEVEFGVRLVAVRRDSPAELSGFKKGDIFTHVYQAPIRSVKEFTELLNLLKSGQTVAIRVVRRGFPAFIPLTLP